MVAQTEVLVIGAGPGGYPAAIRAAQLGADVTLVEEEAYGGVCLNHGCIPSKALITATDLAEQARSGEAMGIEADVSTNVRQMIDWKDGIVDRLTGGVEHRCRGTGVDLVEGRAEFVDDTTVRVAGAESPDEIEFEHAVVATGSRPIQLPGFDFEADPVMSSRDALAVSSAPDRLLVVGAGYIGMELSTVFARLGSDVTVVEMLDNVLPGYEDDIGQVVRDHAEQSGITFNFGERAQDWRREEDGIVVTTEDESGKTTAYEADRILVAVGREPVTETVNLERTSAETTDDGFVDTDRTGKTAAESIYAVGDVAGEPLLAHAATKEGLVAAHDIADQSLSLENWIVPAAVFTDPEIGTVGLTESEAAEVGFDPVVGKFPFTASGRAMTTGQTDGFVRVVASADGLLLGAQVVGPEASELIAELAFAITQECTLTDLAETIHVHPTLSEAVMEAAENALGQAIHTSN